LSLQPGWTEHRIRRGGAVIGCREAGCGEPVLLLPAGGCPSLYLVGLAETLVRAGWRVISIDARGAGGSTGPEESLTLHDLAADVAAVIEQLDAAPAHVVGHALGNRIARCVAADRPELVQRLALLCAGGQVAPDAETQAAARRLLQTDLDDEQWRAALRAVYLSPHSDPGLVDRLSQSRGATRIQAAANRATTDFEWQDGGSAPMLILQGFDDRMAPPANGHALAARLGARVRVVDVARAGHLLPLEQPDIVARQVVDFLRNG